MTERYRRADGRVVPLPVPSPAPTTHEADPGPFHEDDLDWGLRCIVCNELITPKERKWRHG